MITPNSSTLRRRSLELSESGKREALASDIDSSALLKFYAVECGLKYIYMDRNNLKHTDEERGGKSAARSFGHKIQSLIEALNVSAKEIPKPPPIVHRNSGQRVPGHQAHEGWRYGEKLEDTKEFCSWLDKVLTWIEAQK